jgi:hypothetical protein
MVGQMLPMRQGLDELFISHFVPGQFAPQWPTLLDQPVWFVLHKRVEPWRPVHVQESLDMSKLPAESSSPRVQLNNGDLACLRKEPGWVDTIV